ncbi:MAG: efflux RND transporter periplasmic adaptor subunit [Oligoflexia bacterium]|nr:efflux RND transporter periplasmic adaptor subunit [Oligoflexia bacterium]
MKTKPNLIAWTLTLALAASIAVVAPGCTRKDGHNSHSASEEKATYVCPMHPQVRSDKPGSCPICKMDLVKEVRSAPAPTPAVTDHSAHGAPHATTGTPASPSPEQTLPAGHARFQITLDRQQEIGVRTGIVERRPLFKEIRAPGRVAFDPELYTAQTEYREALEQLQRVKNAPLADVRHSAERMVESAKLRLKILGLSDKQIAGLAAGPSADPDSLLLSQKGGNVWIYAEVFEMDLPSITPGLEATLTASALQGKTLTGTVVSVDRILNTMTRTAKVRISVPNAKPILRPETYVDVRIRTPLGRQIAVPFDAVLDTGKEAWVFVAQPGGHFDPRLVNVKFHADDWIAVESGLKEGETIVTSANFLIDSESRLRGAALSAGTPSCPKGQAWDAGMSMCMPVAGGSP